MPLYFTPEQETEALKRRGFSSDDYQIEPETGAIRRRQRIQPSFDVKTPTEQLGIEGSLEKSKDDKPSVAASFGRGFVSELGPSSGAILTGSRVATALTPWATQMAPSTRGLSLAVPPIAGIGTGLLTALGLGKVQESILPESVKETLRQDVATNPTASLSGRIAANFPLMRPSISNLGRAAGTTGHIAENLITGGVRGPVNPADLSNLVNVGLGAGTGAASSIVPKLLEGQPIDPKEAILSSFGGALFSEPTKFLGTKLGLTPTGPKVDRLKRLQAEQKKGGVSLEQRATERLRPSDEDVEAFDTAEVDTRPTNFYSEKNNKDEYLTPLKRIPKQHKELFPAFFDERGKLKNTDEATFREMLDRKLYGEEYELFKSNLEEAKAIKEESDLRQQIEEAKLRNDQNYKVLQNQLEASIAARSKYDEKISTPVEPLKPGKGDTTEYGERKFTTGQLAKKQVTTLKDRSYSKEANYQHWKKLWKKASIEGDERARKEAEKFFEEDFGERYNLEEIEGKPQPKFSEIENLPARIEPKGGTRFQETEQGPQRLSSAEKLENQIKKPEEAIPKASLFDYVQKTFGPLRNIDIQEGVVVDKRTGREAKGVAITQEGVKERIARINPFKATLDTLGHEPFHIFGDDLRLSPNKIDRDIMSRFDKAVAESDDFKRINADRVKRGLQPHSVEEIGTEEFGIEFARRILDPSKMEGTLKKSWHDFLGRLRVKWGKASVEDFTRLLTNRFFKDPDYFTSFKSGVSIPKAEKQQEETYGITSKPQNKPSDNERFDNEESRLSRNELQQKQMEERSKSVNRREQGYKLSEGEQGLNPEQNEKLFLIQKLNKLRKELRDKGVDDIYGDQIDYSGANSKYISGTHKLNEFLNDANIPSDVRLLVHKFLATQDDITNLEIYHTKKPTEKQEKVTEDITDILGRSSIKAAGQAVRDYREFTNVDKNLIKAKYNELSRFLLNRLKQSRPGLKNVDSEFLANEISSFVSGNENVENAYRKRLGDEFVDELNSRIDNELRPLFSERNELERTALASAEKVNRKTEELQAFTREDVSRHQEEEQGLQKGSFVQGANTLRAMDIFGAGMYDKKPGSTIAKEAIQNATDSFDKNQADKKIYTGVTKGDALFIADNGKGMTPSEVITKFLPAFVSGKEGSESRGSFGLAKIALLGSPDGWIIRTTAKAGNKLLTTEVIGSPDKWKKFVSEGLRLDFNPEQPGEYEFHGITFKVKEAEPNSPTGTLYISDVKEGYLGRTQVKKMLADISNDYDVSFKYNYDNELTLAKALKDKNQEFLSEYKQAADLKSLEKHTVPGANVEVKSTSNTAKKIYQIPVFNRGLRQFELPFYQDARLPEGLAIEVTPTVGVEDANYPYTTNRDNLKGEAKKKVEDIIKSLAELQKNQQISMFKNVKKNAKRIGGTHTKYLDLSNSVPEDVINEVINSPVLAALGKIIRPMIRNMLDYATRRIGPGKFENADFSGFASGGDFLGVRFGTRQEGSKGEIYFDPFLLTEKVNQSINNGMYTPEEFPLAYAEAVSGVSVHEIAHQVSHTEGEEHARAMTDLAGVLQGIGHRYEKLIAHKLNQLGSTQSRGELTKLFDKIKQYENKEIASSLVGTGRGKQFSKRPTTRYSESSEEIQSIGQRYEGIGEESKYSTEDQGLNKENYTPENILERIKNTRESKDFKRVGTFIRGLKELASGRLPIVGSDIDKLELRGDVSGKLIAPALREYFALNRELEGRYLNPTLEALNKLKSDEVDDLYSKMLSEKKTGVTQRENLSEKQQEVYDTLRDIIKLKQTEQIKAGQKVQDINFSGKPSYRLPKIDPYYIPEIVGSKQLDILLNETGSPAFNNLKKDFINYQKEQYKLSDAEAKRMFDDLLASYGGPVKGDTTHFGAVRRSEGIGLPESWLESDLSTAMRRYWRRVVKDRAFYDTIENDHDLLHILGRKRDNENRPVKYNENLNSLSGNETLGNIMDIIQGRFIKTNPRLDAASRIASNAVLGPITGITDLINAAPLLAKFIPSVANIPGFLKAGLNITEGVKNAFKQGIIKENVTSLGDIVSPSDEFTEKLRNTANLVSKVNTRETLEKYSRGLSQALSSYLIDVHTGLAESGNQKSIDLLTGLANKKDYTKLSRNELASRLVELTQGTYDPRGLPSWAIDSQIAPFFRLAKWNIEQLNNLHKHVLMPAAKGNLTPLLMTLGGGLIGGYLAKEVREKLNLKKQSYPEYKEILESSRGAKGNIPAIAYNLAAAISYSGITGLLGDITKASFDVAFKNSPQGFNYPLVEIIGDGSVKLAQAADAIAEGETPINVVPKLLEDLFLKNIQIGRVIHNQIAGRTIKKEDFENTESRRNLRSYKMAEGLPYQAQGIQSDMENPYIGLESKEFKKRNIKELPKAIEEGQKLIKDAFKKSKGNIEEFKKKASGFKKMPVTTLPSPENDPVGFSKFINYNNRVRGKEDTRNRLKDYFSQKTANKIKANFIP